MRVRAVKSFIAYLPDGSKQRVQYGQELDLPRGVDWLKAGFVVPVRQAATETATMKPEERERGVVIDDITPAAYELAVSHAVDLSTVEGTGAGGRITKSDVEKALEG